VVDPGEGTEAGVGLLVIEPGEGSEPR
jgi:hypothetical protein